MPSPGLGRFRGNLYLARGTRRRRLPRRSRRELPALDAARACRRWSRRSRTLARGLVLVTGADGKRQEHHARRARRPGEPRPRAITSSSLEDPIEFLHEPKRCLVTQREVASDTDGFGAALKHVLRQDPDVVLVGEMRDRETIEAALTVAETGHLVLSTLHTGSAVQTLTRIVDVFPPHQQAQIRAQLALVLQAVVAQQLVRRRDGTVACSPPRCCSSRPPSATSLRDEKTHQIYSQMQVGQSGTGMQTMSRALMALVERRIDRAPTTPSRAPRSPTRCGACSAPAPREAADDGARSRHPTARDAGPHASGAGPRRRVRGPGAGAGHRQLAVHDRRGAPRRATPSGSSPSRRRSAAAPHGCDDVARRRRGRAARSPTPSAAHADVFPPLYVAAWSGRRGRVACSKPCCTAWRAHLEQSARLRRTVAGGARLPGRRRHRRARRHRGAARLGRPRVRRSAFASAGAELPMPTRWCWRFSAPCDRTGRSALGVLARRRALAVAAANATWPAAPRPAGCCELPGLGPLLAKAAVARATRTLGTLLACGVAILDALDIAARTAGNRVVEDAFDAARTQLARGALAGAAAGADAAIPAIVRQMIAVGESTGTLDVMLARVADCLRRRGAGGRSTPARRARARADPVPRGRDRRARGLDVPAHLPTGRHLG